MNVKVRIEDVTSVTAVGCLFKVRENPSPDQTLSSRLADTFLRVLGGANDSSAQTVPAPRDLDEQRVWAVLPNSFYGLTR